MATPANNLTPKPVTIDPTISPAAPIIETPAPSSPQNPADSPPTAPTTAALQQAPAAVKRSMPMGLSICVGILLAALAGAFFYYLTWFILLIYLAFIAATILDAPVQWLKRRGLRHSFGSILVTIASFGALAAILYAAFSSLYGQASAVGPNLAKAPERLNQYIDRFQKSFPASTQSFGEINVGSATSQLIPEASTVLSNAYSGFEAVAWFVIFFFLVLYMLVEGPDHLLSARTLLPKRYRVEATRLFQLICEAHRGWALASAGNILSASILTSIGLYFLGVPGAFAFGLIAGFGELVPNIGPLVAAIPAILITLLAEPEKTGYVIGLFVVIQTIQSYTLTPLLMKISIQLPVLVTIIAAIVFGTLFGLLGVLIAIPFVADLVVIGQYINARREKDTTDYDSVNIAPNGTRQSLPTEPHPTPARP